MKDIGIITFHSAHNYGAMLQVYALQEIINRDNNCNIINYRNYKIDKQYKLFKISKDNIKSRIKSIISSFIFLKNNLKRYKKFNDFMESHLRLSSTYSSELDLKLLFPKYDVYITGSDQVWNPDIVGSLEDSYTLNFGGDYIKRISYAASIGNSTIQDIYMQDYKNKLKILDHISVRENDAKKELDKFIEKPIEVTLDPTLLLSKSEWDEKIGDYEPEKEKYILAYVVEENEEYRKIVNYLSQKTGLKVIHFEKRNKYNNTMRSAYTDGPLEFVNLIKNAEYVIATSFHALVFSIIYNKKFFIVPHLKTGSRVTNLLEKLSINDRVVHSLDEFKNKDYDSEIDYKKVNNILEKEREKSINWLNNAIEN